ncbi:hypothetical protein NADFUDRAFT_83419 [Nadsonia fulvescens var. elongata DSM 6958]|uniref:Putative gamma-glutamylcyclotransferase n=1 Tax=Nadsonia fulvescens var. elongata DSM 6958 TaxID=857566 RepID=A0A1E3PJS8_9ASCO|nr:hypothetical protein NADFUDRAFT_83419 [Nadsonia fulvescens var. elongata DSM 6958]
MTVTQDRYTAFFYGTLMIDKVLSRVIYGTDDIPVNSPLIIKPAQLNDYQRFSITNADYPAIRPRVSQTVHGKVVYNLIAEQLVQLDIFEGDEYSREKVVVVIGNGERVYAETYIWVDGEDRLMEEDWNVENFVEEKLDVWISNEIGPLG